MKKLLLVGVAAAWTQAVALADIVSSPDASFVSIPGNYQTTTGSGTSPFWNNLSLDGASMNAGYFLMGANASLGTTNYLGGFGQYLSTGAPEVDAPTDFSFLRTATSVRITLLYTNGEANFGSSGTEIGFYNVQDPSQRQVVFAHGTLYNPANPTGVFNNNFSPQPTFVVNPSWPSYGIYASTCGFDPDGSVYCSTFYSNTGLRDTVPTHQRFALFRDPQNPLTYYVGFEDIRGSYVTEGYREFNDAIFRLETTHMPEPATYSAIGLGLLALAAMKRFRQ